MAGWNAPPESIWPTGATPPELAAAMHAEGLKTPEEVRRERMAVVPQQGMPQPRPVLAEVTGAQGLPGTVYMPPPRPQPDRMQLEQERMLHQLNQPAPPLPPMPVQLTPQPCPSLTYNLPLGHGKRAEVYLWGPVGPDDIRLLLKHIRLMRGIEPPPVASRPQEEPKTRFTFDPNGTLTPKVNGKKPRKQA